MNLIREARKLANYIQSLEDEFIIYSTHKEFEHNHIGALLTDIILQAGLNYKTVVKPRIEDILINYPNADTLCEFKSLIYAKGLENVINWKHSIKLNRIIELVEFLSDNNVNTCDDLKSYLLSASNRNELLAIHGIGFKTVDYLQKLLDFDIVAVDRHIYSFVENADIEIKGYEATKKTVEYAADFLNISRTSLDCSIWNYMSKKDYNKTNAQLEMQFNI
ncbi:hypothetical protein [Flavobacterium lindanitolerans]|uniref:hypothetical protein n=1 Tax=Flavobacterium lindanitolerans TaxID=428988 RepID=UPI001A5163D3|nr:hypothetical protein [Flavobacterium lindanitolerans]MBL7866770.1 hypothetical protein [Flavobacterium lindanitolerans]MDQ7959567.1 hypothetical protein [Flavobacterium lindanitolerans]